MRSIQELFKRGRTLLKDLPNPHIEAKLLLLKCASISEEQFYSSPEMRLARAQERRFYKLISTRLSGFPLPYLTGTKEFWSISFRVFPDVQIPRPETELVVEKLLELSSEGDETVMDIGTGCGNIAISLAKELPLARIIATDKSRKALQIARINASRLKVANVFFIRSNLFSSIFFKRRHLEEKCDFIVSNPPYVSEEEWQHLDEEIRNYEPKSALVAGETGLELIKEIIHGSLLFLKPGGYILIEIGKDQEKRVQSIFKASSGWEKVNFFKDLSGITRVVLGKKLKF